MQIGATDSTGANFDQELARTRLRPREFRGVERLSRSMEDHCAHDTMEGKSWPGSRRLGVFEHRLICRRRREESHLFERRCILRRLRDSLQSRSAPVLGRSNVKKLMSHAKWSRARAVGPCCDRGRAHSAAAHLTGLALGYPDAYASGTSSPTRFSLLQSQLVAANYCSITPATNKKDRL